MNLTPGGETTGCHSDKANERTQTPVAVKRQARRVHSHVDNSCQGKVFHKPQQAKQSCSNRAINNIWIYINEMVHLTNSYYIITLY